MSIQLTPQQAASLATLRDQGRYADAYRYMRDLVVSSGGDARLSNWLDAAAQINSNDSGLYSEFVRDASWEAAYDMGQTLSREQFMDGFQVASDRLALAVIDASLGGGEISDLNTILKTDVAVAVESLGLTAEGWAGTFGAWFPMWMGGLDLDYDSPLYQDLYRDFHERGVDNFSEIMSRWVDVIENNLATLDVLTESLLRDLWTTLSDLHDTLRDIVYDVSMQYSAAMNWIMRRDPLTLDLDGDGIESTGVNQNNPILFDHDGDGVKHATGWISSDDGLLVLDRNGNGAIDSGRELFGDSTRLANGSNAADGFAALAAEDTNSDGRVDASDARFSQLRVWRDLNQDGVSQGGELFTLQQLGISAINVASVERNQVLANGNQIADVGTYVRSDGTEGTVGETHGAADVDLAEDTFYREFPDQVPIAAGVTDLPNMSGSGRVRDFKIEAAGRARRPKLRSLPLAA